MSLHSNAHKTNIIEENSIFFPSQSDKKNNMKLTRTFQWHTRMEILSYHFSIGYTSTQNGLQSVKVLHSDPIHLIFKTTNTIYVHIHAKKFDFLIFIKYTQKY